MAKKNPINVTSENFGDLLIQGLEEAVAIEEGRAQPFRGSRRKITARNGGSDNLLNAHLATLEGERFRAYRGQSHGVDLVKVGAWALRAHGLAPTNPADYAIFGEPVYAPCSGSVVQAVDGLVDLQPPRTDREHMAGNHVVIACGDVRVLLAHFQNGSVSVVPGDTVGVGDQVGRVGNTGNTDEPHLHVHAQRPGTKEEAFSGDPLPIRLNGRYLVRNARIEVDPEED